MLSPFIWKSRSIMFANNDRSRGITKIIRTLFAPGFTYGKLKKKPLPKATALSYRQARARGKLIDRQLTKWHLFKSLKGAKIETKLLVTYLSNQHLVPIATQLPVGCPVDRLGTCIDLVCTDTITKEIVLIEIKRGCHYRDCTTGQMLRTIVDLDGRPVNDCLLHQHMLQLLLGELLFVRTFPTRPHRCLLLYVDTVEVLAYHINIQLSTSTLSILSSTR
jgi:hypothetical protein